MSVRHSSGAWRLAALVLAAAAALVPTPAAAQDVEMMAHAMGREVPRGYYERLRRNARAFEWPGTARLGTARPPWEAAVIPPRSGVLTIVVIPALFADSPAPSITSQELQRILFDGPAVDGTIAEAYREYSNGQLQVRGTVLPWVRSALTLQQVLGSDQGFGDDARLGDYVLDAFQLSDPNVDYAQFDNNGPDAVPNSADDNGVVDAAIVLYPDRALPCGGTGPWPALSGFGAWFPFAAWPSQDLRPTGAPITVSGFIVSSASACVGSGPLNSAILAHELGHTMGLPDLYDASGGLFPSDRRWEAGCWDLMSAGAWGCGNGAALAHGTRPTHLGAWSKETMGWLAPTIVSSGTRDQEYVLHAANRSADALKVPIGADEYYLIEYREQDGFDRDLPESGVLVWHVDPDAPGPQPGGAPTLYRVMLEEADGNAALLASASAGGNRGEAGDAFGAPGRARFSAATTPPARLHNGDAVVFTVHSVVIDAAQHLARVRVTFEANPVIAATVLSQWPAITDDRRVLRVTGGAEPYTVTMTGRLPRGVSLTAVADDLIVAGVPLEAGTFTPTVTVQESLGRTTAQQLTLTVSAPVFELADLLTPLLVPGAPPLADLPREFLDEQGNRNSTFDVGDLRAYVLAR